MCATPSYAVRILLCVSFLTICSDIACGQVSGLGAGRGGGFLTDTFGLREAPWREFYGPEDRYPENWLRRNRHGIFFPYGDVRPDDSIPRPRPITFPKPHIPFKQCGEDIRCKEGEECVIGVCLRKEGN